LAVPCVNAIKFIDAAKKEKNTLSFAGAPTAAIHHRLLGGRHVAVHASAEAHDGREKYCGGSSHRSLACFWSPGGWIGARTPPHTMDIRLTKLLKALLVADQGISDPQGYITHS